MKTPDELVTAFRASGRKVTPQRERIFRVLFENPTHPTAEAVHAAITVEMPTVSLRTVYATLHELAELGELQLLDLGTGSTRFDPNLADHHHLVCDACGAVHDLEASFPDVSLPADNPYGFEVDATQIVFRGRCRHCTGRQTTPPPPGNTNKEQHTHG